MPAVDVAMQRSLRGGFIDLLAASLRPVLQRRDIQQQVTDVRTAFSSWDNCMQVNYCKWPVIALIIIGGLIIFSVVWCIIRCACCGLSCCCSCFSCLKCCGNCCGCCDPPRGSRHKYLDEPYIPPSQGYKSQEPMHSGFAGPTVPSVKAPDFPQYAVFDAGGKKNEDALPQMPSWEGAENKKVMLEEEAVEMNALKKHEDGAQATAAGMNGAGAVSPVSPNARSPVNRTPYGPPGAGPAPASSGFFGPGAHESDPYAQGAPTYNQPGMAYSEPDQGYGMAVSAMGPGRQSPRAYNNGGYNDRYNDNNGYSQAHDYPPSAGGYGAPRHQPYDNYDNYGPPNNQRQPPHEMDTTPYLQQGMGRNSPAPQGGPYGAAAAIAAPYGPDSRRSPAPQGPPFGGPDARRSPAPQGGQYGPGPRRSPAPQGSGSSFDSHVGRPPYGAPARQYSPDPTHPLSAPPPQRQFSSSSGPNRNGNGSASPSPLRNDAGFDFTSGYSRPPASASVSALGGYRQPSPVGVQGEQGQGQDGAYPGYKPYQPAA